MKRRESLEILQTEIKCPDLCLEQTNEIYVHQSLKSWTEKKITKGKLDVIRVRKAPPTKPETYQ